MLYAHIKALEARLDKEKKAFNSENNTDYFCWLLVSTNYIVVNLEYKYLRHNADVKAEEKISYDNMIASFKSSNGYDGSNAHWLKKAIELRNRLAHLGIPNIIVDAKNTKFLEQVIEGDYFQAKKCFLESSRFLQAIDDPVVEFPGIGFIGKRS